ncbi:uncharacterized protein LOC129564889 isoform X2 [Sitodiplosis mosellana]|uniref:uncharacterized protein LOC129564889 isoform X2 n=1 Tax=Sitodiplosis mosellana TaxID=263140 RepID=UPI002444234A|nr:uncharacterized protein LOC129564889 isoform X2 [Sitodiplosis mosellana]
MAIQWSNFVCIFAVGAVFHISLVNAILHPNIGVLPIEPSLPVTFLDPVNTPVYSGYDSNFVTTNDLSKLTAFSPTYYTPQTLSTVFGTVKSPNDLFDDYSYYHNGRYLKQYFVSEENVDDINALNSFLSRFMPFVPANYNVPASKLPNLGFPTITPSPPQTVPAQNNPFNGFYSINTINPFSAINPRVAPVQPVRPVQLGSGSLGYVRLPNGAVYLGSGSLGYTNDRIKADELNEVRNRQSPQASPLTFGETPR